ncbi:hypothetical protein [Streptomyces sp. NPDC091416]|uniref:hypothetical protein n=1 Tax=Streptomyces sp. NPDC091416 TaxID=3366003 RepID=UPI0037F4EE1B
MTKIGTGDRAAWRRWALRRGAPCATVAVAVIGVGLTVGVRSATGTALVITGAVGALFAFVLTMPRPSREHETG